MSGITRQGEELSDAGGAGLATEVRAAWYAVQVKRHGEERVARRLALRAVPVFLPHIEVLRRSLPRRLPRLEPLFPGYLLVRLPAVETNRHRWAAVRWCPGVQRILGVGDTPVAVPDEVIEAIQERVRVLGFVRPGMRFTLGSRVRIWCGPLAGLEAVFDRPLSRAGRVRVLLEMLGQTWKVEVDLVDLDAA